MHAKIISNLKWLEETKKLLRENYEYAKKENEELKRELAIHKGRSEKSKECIVVKFRAK